MPEGDEQAVDRVTGLRDSDTPARSLGRVLKEARERQSLSLEQIAADLRIERHLLKALEEDRLKELGAPVFAKGYLKQYGQRLGLRYEDLLGHYYDQVEPQDIPITPSRSIKLRDERQITMWLVCGLALALLAVLLFIWWVSEPGGNAALGASSPPEQPTAELPTSESAAPRESDRGPAAQPQQAPSDRADGAPPPEAEAPAAALPVPQAADDIRIDLVFEADSWAEVTDGNGERLYYGLGHAGARSTLDAVGPVAVLLGNADGVRVLVDGNDYAIPKTSRQGNLARFTLHASDD